MLEKYAKEIIVGIIVTVVGGLILANLTGEKSTTPVVEAPVSSAAEVVAESPVEAEAPAVAEAAPTMTGVRNPSGVIPAGTKIIVDDLMLVVEDKYKLDTATISKGNIIFYLAVQNISDRQKLFSYTNDSIRIKDNLGNTYQPDLGWDDEAKIMYTVKQDSIEPGEAFSIFSFDVTSALAVERIPWYKGPIASGASQLIIEFDGFGPFSGFSCAIDL